MKLLLELHADHGSWYRDPGWHSGYNEVVVNSRRYNEHLPHAVDAFFLIKGWENANVIYDTVAAHRTFLATYKLAESEVPLLVLDPSNWETPFSAYHA